MAAKWEMEDSGSMDNARSLLQQGLRFNKENKQLWQEVRIMYIWGNITYTCTIKI